LRRLHVALFFFAAMIAVAVPPLVAEPLTLRSTFALPQDVSGNFDHLAIDTHGKRLFLTPEAYKSVLVLDYTTGEIVHVIGGIGTPHAVLYRQDLNRIYVTDGDPGAVKIFDGTTYTLIKSIPLSAHTDSIRYDARTSLLYVITGGKEAKQSASEIIIVDTTAGTVAGSIKVESEALEAMVIDSEAGKLYVCDKAQNRIAVIDLHTRSVITTWPITLGQTTTSLALDEGHHRLFVGCRSGNLVLFDTVSRKELTSLPLTKGVDDMIYDPGTKRLYASCGAGQGVIEVYQQSASGEPVLSAQIPSGPLGKTSLLSTILHQYFVSVPRHGDTAASVLVFDVR
jgi:DNA-binding beta-propeller fold protein YncE